MSSERIFVAGHNGMVGSAICRSLKRRGNSELVLRSRTELDLRDQLAVNNFFESESIDQVYLAAANVGGIHANATFPAEFIVNNLMIQTNVIHGAFQAGVEQLMFLGSSCICPRNAEQPIKENALLTGRLEKTNEPYAIAKIAGLKLCESFVRQYGVDYRCLMPANLYGPGDNYHPDNSHVIPALIARFHKAKISGEPNVAIWGSGTPKREFVYVDDLAEASVHVMEIPRGSFWSGRDTMCSHVNVGSGSELSISNLAQTISSVVEYDGVSFLMKVNLTVHPEK